MNTVTRWHHRLVEQCSLEDLKLLCAELEVDFDTLPEGGKGTKALELVQQLARYDRLGELEQAFNQYRPTVSASPPASTEQPPYALVTLLERAATRHSRDLWAGLAGVGGLLMLVALLTYLGGANLMERLGWEGALGGVGLVLVLVGMAGVRAGRQQSDQYELQYRKYLSYRHRNFDVKGLTTQGTFTLELQQVFVELALDPSFQPTPDPLQRNRALVDANARTIWEHLKAEPLRQHHFVILGPPGSGKTTLLKHVALALSGGKNGRDTTQTLPILLFLRDHTTAICQRPTFSLLDALHTILTRDEVSFPADWWQRHLAAGRCLILLDGLDEVADAGERRAVVTWVERQMTRYAPNRFLVTSRPHGYKANPFGEVPVAVMEVRPFTQAQVRHFVENWYLANEIMAAQKEDEGVRLEARDGATDLLERLRRTPTLAELAVNPLLLTMIATIHRYRSSLPGRRVELYAEICEVFLGKRRGAVGITDLDLTPAQKQSVLEPLAYYMMVHDQREIPLTEVVGVIDAPLALVGTQMPAATFLKGIEESSGLLLERENGSYGFAHKTFQEYLAAVHIKQHQLESDLLQRLEDPWWHETIRLHCAQTDATPIIEACLDAERGSVAALALAIECAEEAKQLRATTRAHLTEVLDAGIESKDDALRRLVAETRLMLRLRRMRPIGAEVYLDDSLVTQAEYQLFLDEVWAQGEAYRPLHWTGYRFPRGAGNLPVLGVRSGNALTFCKWLTERDPTHEWCYRLPTPEEVDEEWRRVTLPTQAPEGTGYWIGLGPSLTWLSGDGSDPEIDSARLWNLIEHTMDEVALTHLRTLYPSKARPILEPEQRHPLIRDPDSSRVRARDLVCALDRDLAHALEQAIQLFLEPTPIRARSRILSQANTDMLRLALDLALALLRVYERDLDHLRSTQVDARTYSNSDSEHESGGSRHWYKNHTSTLDSTLVLARANLNHSNLVYLLNVARDYAQDLPHTGTINRTLTQLYIHGILSYLAICEKSDSEQPQKADIQLRPLQRLALLSIRHWATVLATPPNSWGAHFGGERKAAVELAQTRFNHAFDQFRTLVILDLRCRGELPAYEGIRLVKERRDS